MILILITCYLRMLRKLILEFKILTCLSVRNIQLIYIEDYWILHLIRYIPNCFFSTITLQGPFRSLFSKSDHYIHIEFSFQQFSFQSSLLINTYADILLKLLKIFGGNNHRSKVIISFLF